MASRLALDRVEAVHGFCFHQYYQCCQAASHEDAAILHALVLKENRKAEEFDNLTMSAGFGKSLKKVYG